MIMNFASKVGATKIQLIKELYENYENASKWIDSVPREIQDAFFDNPYVAHLSNNENILLNHVFNQTERDWVDWILFEWRHNKTLEFSAGFAKPRSCDNLDELLENIFGDSNK